MSLPVPVGRPHYSRGHHWAGAGDRNAAYWANTHVHRVRLRDRGYTPVSARQTLTRAEYDRVHEHDGDGAT
jgi:hypothetical protein